MAKAVDRIVKKAAGYYVLRWFTPFRIFFYTEYIFVSTGTVLTDRYLNYIALFLCILYTMYIK